MFYCHHVAVHTCAYMINTHIKTACPKQRQKKIERKTKRLIFCLPPNHYYYKIGRRNDERNVVNKLYMSLLPDDCRVVHCLCSVKF